MILDLDGWLKIASILVTLLLWIITNSKRARLEAFFIHAASHPIPGAGNQQVNTHALVVRNAGTKPAINLRVVHNVMPESIRVWPTVNYTVNNLPLGGELLFPALVPREQITISYLYAPPLTYDQIGALVKSDDGLAQVLPITTYTRIVPPWLRRVYALLSAVGFATVTFILLKYLVLPFFAN